MKSASEDTWDSHNNDIVTQMGLVTHFIQIELPDYVEGAFIFSIGAGGRGGGKVVNNKTKSKVCPKTVKHKAKIVTYI